MPGVKAYLTDASHFRGEAERVVLPSSEEEVCALLREAQRARAPVTIAGAGTGLTGSRVPQGGTVLSTEKLNRILQVYKNPATSPSGGLARLQPAVTLKQLEEAAQADCLFYPPDPGEKAAGVTSVCVPEMLSLPNVAVA